MVLQTNLNKCLKSTIGFLITGVGLPVIAAVAMARLGGSMEELCKPIGARAGFIATAICFLCIGPLFAIPRTATVAYELAIKPFIATDVDILPGYSVFYFIIALIFAMYPAKILDTVGKFLSPIKITALIILCCTAIFVMPSEPTPPTEEFVNGAFGIGIVNGYLTLDTLASLAFCIIIVSAIKAHGVTAPRSVTKYAIMSGCMAGGGFIFIYLCLFRLGNTSIALTPNATNGAEVLSAYVHYAFGSLGNIFLAVLIIVACLVTAIGLICACSSYFGQIWPIKYRYYAIIFAVVSCAIANFGLTTLIKVSVPGLITVYPLFIVLVMTSFVRNFFHKQSFVIAPTCILALLFGFVDGFDAAGISILPESITAVLPLYDSDLAWLIPCLAMCIVLAIVDHFVNPKEKQPEPVAEHLETIDDNSGFTLKKDKDVVYDIKD